MNSIKDDNGVYSILGISSVDGITPIPIKVNPVTGALLLQLIGGSSVNWGQIGGSITNQLDLIAELNKKENILNKGQPNGYAELDGSGRVPSTQLPASVDEIEEYNTYADLPVLGSTGIIYITLNDNLTYRWGGSTYVEISQSIALGETSMTAYRGDRGKTAYDHSQTSGNPHSTSKTDIGLSDVDNTSDLDKPISTATQTALNSKTNNTDLFGNGQGRQNVTGSRAIGTYYKNNNLTKPLHVKICVTSTTTSTVTASLGPAVSDFPGTSSTASGQKMYIDFMVPPGGTITSSYRINTFGGAYTLTSWWEFI